MVSIAEPPCYNHIINGQDTPPKENAYIDVICPATGKIIALTADGDARDVDLAVEAASTAFKNKDLAVYGARTTLKTTLSIGQYRAGQRTGIGPTGS